MCKWRCAGRGALIWQEKDIVQSVNKLLKITTHLIKSSQAPARMQDTKAAVKTGIALKTGGCVFTDGGSITNS